MADKRFEVELPEEVLAAFGWQEAEVPQKLREAVVMELLRLDRISEAQAAAFLTLDRYELLETMGRYQVPAIRMTPAELRRELTQEIRFCRKVRFWGKIPKLGVRNSMAYRCQHSRKSNFATEPKKALIRI